ncbi:MAG: biopolymer transporter ExbD [Muribaculaceae bacterium]|nr:biopolymer transporter ExbD [Muribaculaceae bacterium]
MGKVKIKRKSTLIDMTAMSDVTVLLLTFFMLTSTFLQKEPAMVITPSSVSDEKVPTSDFVTVLVSSESADERLTPEQRQQEEGKVFLSFAGSTDSTYSSPYVRKRILEKAVSIYNSQHEKQKIELDPNQIQAFSGIHMFGVPFQFLPTYLSMSDLERDKFQKNLSDPNMGIPYDTFNKDPKSSRLNELQIWFRAIRETAEGISKDRKEALKASGATDEEIQQMEDFKKALQEGKGIGVKADRNTPWTVVARVFDNLQTMSLNKFIIMTSLASEDN